MTPRGSDDNPFEGVYVRLVSSGLLDRGGQAAVLALVSRLRGEGVTTMCVGLARTIAATGKKVLLVDASPGARRAAAVLGLSAEPLPDDCAPDLAAVQRVVVETPSQGYDVLVLAGAELATQRWAAVWNGIRSLYDVILVDAGSLETDVPHRWRGAIDKSLLVMDPARTTYEILERFKSDLDHSRLQLSGFVMNRRTFPVPGILYRLAR